MRTLPLVSIIIPVYNRLDRLKRSIASVLRQSYPYWELIIVDDGSEEDIASYANTLKKQVTQSIGFIHQENQGPGIARKHGLELAKGTYIQYLDSDDEIMPEKLIKQVTLMETDPDAVMCYTPTISKGYGGSESLRKFSDEFEPDLLKGSLEWRRWHTSSCLWRYPKKSIAQWSKYYHGEDVLHDVFVGVKCRKVLFLPESLCVAYSDHEARLSNYPDDQKKQERYAEAVLGVKVECYILLKSSDLIKKKKYSDPLSERFFHSGLKLFKIKNLKRGWISLVYCIRTSRYWLRTCFALFSLLTSITGVLLWPGYFSIIFKLYRKLTPEKIHFRRGL